jgi:hypothetical protein
MFKPVDAGGASHHHKAPHAHQNGEPHGRPQTLQENIGRNLVARMRVHFRARDKASNLKYRIAKKEDRQSKQILFV